MFLKKPQSLTLLFVGLMSVGCGGSNVETVPLASVTGLVSDGGKPVVNAIVEFYPENGRRSVGRTNENGAFVLKYTEEAGAVIGACRVQITPGPPVEPTGGDDVVAPPMKGPAKIIKVPQEVIVVDGDNHFDFDLAKLTVKG